MCQFLQSNFSISTECHSNRWTTPVRRFPRIPLESWENGCQTICQKNAQRNRFHRKNTPRYVHWTFGWSIFFLAKANRFASQTGLVRIKPDESGEAQRGVAVKGNEVLKVNFRKQNLFRQSIFVRWTLEAALNECV